MSKIIALAGKGGVGKTTAASLVLRYLAKNGHSPVLAVDADPNSNLGETLGMKVEKTVGDIRENFMKDPQGIPSGMDKVVYLEMLMNQVLIERKEFDLLDSLNGLVGLGGVLNTVCSVNLFGKECNS
ncbi:MAG: AAA family ATPase, partial [Desulfamplus sp.]|nr:AAA family ATPase [Desulfamplus sp.]